MCGLAKSRAGIYLLMLLAPLFWGGAFGSTKHVLTELPPLTVAAVRFLYKMKTTRWARGSGKLPAMSKKDSLLR